jgi:hypothetical protein
VTNCYSGYQDKESKMEETWNTDEEDSDKCIQDFSPNSLKGECSQLLNFLSKIRSEFNRVH